MACAAPSWRDEVRRKERGFEALEAKITELWGYLNAATSRFLALVAEFDRAKGYERHGLANTAQWLNWQCGIGAVAAREKVRVARALEALPEIADAFAKGEISYSKVRAMTRVATPANESVLVHVARHGTAEHVEKLVRKYRWTQRRDAAKLAQLQHEQRNVSSFFDVDGMFILNARLPPEIGALVAKALELAVEAVRPPGGKVSAETPLQIAANAWRADALRLIAEQYLERHGEETGAGSSADRVQVVVHIDQAMLSEQQAAAEHGPHRCELEDGPALALDTARRLACDATIVGHRRRRRRRAARHRPQDAQHSGRDQPCAESARRRLPLPRLRSDALHRRPSRQALGRRRRDEARQPRHALRLSSRARARRRLRPRPPPTTGSSSSRGPMAGASKRTVRIVSAETIWRRLRRPIAASRTACRTI